MRREKSCKNCILLTCSDSLPHTQNEKALLLLTVLSLIKIFFCFGIGICSYSFVGLFTVYLLKLKSRFYHYSKPKKIVFQIILLCSMQWELALLCFFVILSAGKIIRKSQQEFLHTIFVGLFTAHLFKKKFKILAFTYVEIYAKLAAHQGFQKKRGVLFSAFDPIRNIGAEVKMTCSRQPVDSI